MADQQVFQDRTIEQDKAGNRTRFDFGEDEIKYTLVDKSSSQTFKSPYTQFSRDHGFLIERNTWLMNVGWLWVALGAVLTTLSFAAESGPMPSLWLFLGAGCVLVAWLRTVRFTKVPTESGTLLIIDDAQQPAILAELERRRIDQLRRWHDFLDAEEAPERQRSRLKWLREEGALDEAELAERLDRLERMLAAQPLRTEAPLPGERSALN